MNLEQSLLHLQIDGWCVIEDVIPADRVEAVRTSVERSVAAHRQPASSGKIGFVPGLIRVNQSFAPYLAGRRLMGIAEALLGQHIRISFTSAIINLPGLERGIWHADWPFNQNNAGHIRAPYPDAVMHLTTLWMLSPFTAETGGTLLVPGSHRARNNPTGNNGVEPLALYPTEMQAIGPAGSVLVMDSRLWHASAPNHSPSPRTALAVRYAPWWLNLDVMRPGSVEFARMVEEDGRNDKPVPLVPRDIYAALPEDVKPLYRHWVEE